MKLPELLSYLDAYDPKPAYAQVGVNGEWEAAARLEFDDTTVPSIFSNGVDPSIAAEVFYTLNDGRMIFTGLRYTKGLAVGSPKRFLEAFVDSLAVLKDLRPGPGLEQLGTALNNDSSTYVDSETAYAELGVVDYWKTFDNPILRKRGDAPMTQEALETLLSTKSGVLSNDKNYIAMEFAYPKPEHWIAVQVSEHHDGQHRTNTLELLKLVNMV